MLALVTLVVYWPITRHGFTNFDDDGYITGNSHVKSGLTWSGVVWAFKNTEITNWHPLTWISHMVDWKRYGNNPIGHHVTNVHLHAANAILLFLLLLYTTGFLGRSAMVAFLFALHPAHVESVAWIAERKDVLCAFFWFATLLAYAWYVRKPSWKRYIWVVCGFACALMSKPMAVTLPFTLLLLDIWPLRRITFAPETRARWLSSIWKLCVEKWLLFLMAVLSSVITFIAQRAGGSVIELQALSLWERIGNAAISYWSYVRIMLWPDRLRVYYYYDFNNISVIAAMLSVIALIVVTAVCWRIRKARPYCLVGWLWFLVTLAPVIGIVQVGEQAMAERYIYVPLIGLFIAVVWLVGDAVASSPKIRVVAQLLAIVILAVCAVKTDAQVKVWENTVTLFSHVLEVDPRGEFPNTTLGAAYLREGKLAEAEDYFERSLAYNPNWTVALTYSATCLMKTHDPRNLPLAKQRLDQALRVTPNDPDTLTDMALWSNLTGSPKDGEIYSRMVLAAHPDVITARLYLADALQSQNKLDGAVQEYRKVIAMDPDNYNVHNSLGNVYDGQGLPQEAIREFRLSLAIKPDQAIPHSKIGRIFLETHQFPEAVEEITQALRFDPTDAHAHNDLGVALFQLGEYEKAAGQFGDAVRIDPAYADARRNLDLAQARTKKRKG
jgi:tetratricopeptide (TPR) repeat protein